MAALECIEIKALKCNVDEADEDEVDEADEEFSEANFGGMIGAEDWIDDDDEDFWGPGGARRFYDAFN